MRSKKYSINYRDVAHGFLVAFLSASATGLMELLSVGHVPAIEDIKKHIMIGLSGGIAYLFKQFISNSEGKIKSENNDNQQAYKL